MLRKLERIKKVVIIIFVKSHDPSWLQIEGKKHNVGFQKFNEVLSTIALLSEP